MSWSSIGCLCFGVPQEDIVHAAKLRVSLQLRRSLAKKFSVVEEIVATEEIDS